MRFPFTLKSSCVSVLRLGLKFTSSNQGLKHSSIRISKPSNSKQLLFFLFVSTCDDVLNWYVFGKYISTPFHRRGSADIIVFTTISLIYSKRPFIFKPRAWPLSFNDWRYSLNTLKDHLVFLLYSGFTSLFILVSDRRAPVSFSELVHRGSSFDICFLFIE